MLAINDMQRKFHAAQYVRISSEHQQYSTLNQSDTINEYGERREIEILRTYAGNCSGGWQKMVAR